MKSTLKKKGTDMKRKLVAILLSAVCMASAPVGIFAQEAGNAAETEVKEESEDSEAEDADSEDTAEKIQDEAEDTVGEEEILEEAETAAEEAVAARPDYKALDYVKLGEYKGLSVKADPVEVTDEMVDDETEIRISESGDDVMETITEGTVEDGDTANIDYEGKKDGVAFDGGTAEGFDLEIGSGTFIDGFEDGLIGVKIGDTVDLNLTFPENYQAEDLAGQAVVFTVTVNEVKRMPEITDEVVKTATDGEYEDLASYKENVRKDLEEEQEIQRRDNILADLMEQICSNSEVSEYPQDLIDYNVDSMTSYYENMASMYGMKFEDFLSAAMGMTKEEYDEKLPEVIKEGLLQEFCIKGIAETEGIEISDEEFEAGCNENMENYGYTDKEEFLKAIGGESVLRLNLIQEKVYDFLMENSVIEEA